MTEIADLDGAINEDPSVVNGAIAKFLAYYTDTAHPLDYAVLIDGPWGAGKTYLVEQFIEESTHFRPLYVSLYGMTKVSQIEDEFYRQLHPVLSSKGMKLAGAVARGLLKATIKVDLNNDGKDDGTLNPSLSEVDFLSGSDNPKGRLLIFDDIERCRIPIAELLGFINGYVEHDGLKAVLIAHEKRIRKKNGKAYAEIKEKLIGQTLTVAADTQAAYDHFLELVGNVRVKAFLLDRRDKIIAIHAQSNKGNLRLLKHALWDFEKFALHFSETHWAKPKVIERAMEAIAALSIEARAGDLDEDTIQGLIDNHIGRLFRGQAGKLRGVADEVNSHYPQVNFDDTIVPKTLLIAGLFRGVSTAMLFARRWTRTRTTPLNRNSSSGSARPTRFSPRTTRWTKSSSSWKKVSRKTRLPIAASFYTSWGRSFGSRGLGSSTSPSKRSSTKGKLILPLWRNGEK